jgi:rhamnulokinase
LTANLANIHVYAGPSEATAIGNLLVQMISKSEISNIKEARAMIRQSFEMSTYSPQDGNWQEVVAGYKQFLQSIKKH